MNEETDLTGGSQAGKQVSDAMKLAEVAESEETVEVQAEDSPDVIPVEVMPQSETEVVNHE